MITFRRILPSFILATCLGAIASAAPQDRGLFLRTPSVYGDKIVFSCANQLWTASLSGGAARPLTTGTGKKAGPFISSDGKWIAFSGHYEGNTDVYVMPSEGGVPKRLTFHPGADIVVGWTPDSRHILFQSPRNSFSRFSRLFLVSIDGGLPSEMPLPEGVMGSFSPDGKYLAYVPVWDWMSGSAWKHYQGGRSARIWIARLSDSSIERIPRSNSNDFNPIWAGDKIYFLSDREGPVTLFSYDTKSKQVEMLIGNQGPDIKWASYSPGQIVYEQLGSIYRLDLETQKSVRLNISVPADLPELQPHFLPVGDDISNYDISPTGVRAVFESHGEVLTVPAQQGDPRNLTNTPGVAERFPAWSPDGKWIAYFSDESGEYALQLRSQDGTETQKIDLGSPPSFFYSPVWSPDNKKIAYTDKRLNLWYVNLAERVPIKVATDYYDSPVRGLDPSWSPDSRWLAYTAQLSNHMRAVFIYSLELKKTVQVTDGMSDARFAVFDRSGKYLYLTASTNAGPTMGWLDLSSFSRQVTRSVYAVILRKELPTPLTRESDEEKVASKIADNGPDKLAVQTQVKPGKAETKTEESNGSATEEKTADHSDSIKTHIDFENIDQRIIALPVPSRNYEGLQSADSGKLYLVEAAAQSDGRSGPKNLYRFDLTSRTTVKLLDGILAFKLSFDGSKMLFAQGSRWHPKWAIGSVPPVRGGQSDESSVPVQRTPLNTDALEIYVDPVAEWKQMYHEAWRIERDFFYDPNLHGLDWKVSERYYQPYLASLSSRDDLDYLLTEMLGELSVSHIFIEPPAEEESSEPKTGLLGADYRIENNLYRFDRIYRGENWNPELRAPLTEPGINIREGEYLLEVNGRKLTAQDNIFELFRGTAGRSTTLRISSDESGKAARNVVIVPIENEVSLRNRAWIDANRRKVEELSGGRLGYVYLPDTAANGYVYFNRYYFAQINKEGVLLDERFNRGGAAADYIMAYLSRPRMNYWTTREGHDFTTPVGAIFGPKAMLINMYAGSGGDVLPWYFRQEHLGPLVGTRTWGMVIGVYDYPELVDGGHVPAPRIAFYSNGGQWEIEDHGVDPDIEVELLPEAWRKGHDPQLEKAVEVLLQELKTHPVPHAGKPPFPNHHQKPALSAAPAGNQN